MISWMSDFDICENIDFSMSLERIQARLYDDALLSFGPPTNDGKRADGHSSLDVADVHLFIT